MASSTKVQDIPLHLVQEPVHPMRSDVWDDEVDDLARSIAEFGLLSPVAVRPVDGGYEIIAGHRRLAAHRKLGKATIAAVVHKVDEDTNDKIKIHENYFRRSVNPADDAIFFSDYLKRSGKSVSEFAEFISMSVAAVQARLDMLNYPPYLFEMVRDGKLSMATAAILNQITDPKIKEDYSYAAAQTGLTSTRAKYWLAQANQGRIDISSVSDEASDAAQSAASQGQLMMKCILDGEMHPADEMISVFVQHQNLLDYEDELNAAKKRVASERSSAL